MPLYEFEISVPFTHTARVRAEADSLEQAQAMVLDPAFYCDPANANFVQDEVQGLDGAYLLHEGGPVEEVAAPKP